MSKVKKGLAAEHIAKAKFLLNGFDVYQEVNYDSKCDLILKDGTSLYRCQVKAITKDGIINFRKLTHSKTQHKQHHYSCTDVDYFVAVDVNTFDVYMIPITEITRSQKRAYLIPEYKNNFNLEPCCGNTSSASPQVGETFDNGNTELESNNVILAARGSTGKSKTFASSVETLRETSKVDETMMKIKSRPQMNNQQRKL